MQCLNLVVELKSTILVGKLFQASIYHLNNANEAMLRKKMLVVPRGRGSSQ